MPDTPTSISGSYLDWDDLNRRSKFKKFIIIIITNIIKIIIKICRFNI